MAETVGRRIQRLAQEKGLPSGKALASLLGVSYETLRAWSVDNAKIAPNRHRAARIASTLSTSIEHIMFGTEPSGTELLGADAIAIAEAFDAVPADTTAAIARRAKLYTAILQLIELQSDDIAPSTPSHAPAETPTPPRPQTSETQP